MHTRIHTHTYIHAHTYTYTHAYTYNKIHTCDLMYKTVMEWYINVNEIVFCKAKGVYDCVLMDQLQLMEVEIERVSLLSTLSLLLIEW